MAKFSFPALTAGPPSRRNWYKELLEDPKCEGDATRVQEAYEVHREPWREKQIELFSNAITNPVVPDQALIKHLARQDRLREGNGLNEDDTNIQEMNCCVIWARPPPDVLNMIQRGQDDLASLVGEDIYLIPRQNLHVSVIELSHRHTVSQLRSVTNEIGSSRIQDILDLVSSLDRKPALIGPRLSFDKMGVALSYLPSDTDPYTYHHLRSDMHSLALDSGIKGLDICYTAPSAHVSLGKFIGNKFFEKPEARQAFVKLIRDLDEELKSGDHGWVIGGTQGLEMQLGYLKFGRQREKADMIGTM